MAIGTEIPPIFTESSARSRPGMNRPSSSPTAIAVRIQRASQRSRNDIFLATGATPGPVIMVLIRGNVLRSMIVYGGG